MEVTDLGLRREAEKAWDFWVTDNFDVYEIEGSIPLEDVVAALRKAKATFIASYIKHESEEIKHG